MQPVRIGIVGFGNQGSAYVNLIHQKKLIDGAVIAAVCDINAPKLAAQCEKFGLSCPTFTTHEEMFKSGMIDAAIITTPHYFHPPIAIDAMRAGLHVLSDKPAGVYTKQVKEMNA